jgi:hypothetical protein
MNMKESSAFIPIVLNPKKDFTALLVGPYLPSINPKSSFTFASIHTFPLDVIILTFSSNISSLKLFLDKCLKILVSPYPHGYQSLIHPFLSF